MKQFSLDKKSDFLIQKELIKLKDQLNQANIKIEKLNNVSRNVKDFEEKFEVFQKLHDEEKVQHKEIGELFKNLTSEKTNIENLLQELKGNKHQLNIERLDRGFIDLLDKKEKQKTNIFRLLTLFGTFIFIVPFLVIASMISGYKVGLTLIGPVITIEVFLVYYFRIILHNYNSIDEQILQLENKSALLKFISHYIGYKKDNAVENDDISKFEDIIFSKISPNMKTIPTSPDVISLVEKVAKIIKK